MGTSIALRPLPAPPLFARPWAEIVGQYRGLALAVARAIIRDGHEAEDVVQEAFAKAFDQISTFDPTREFGPWLTGIVRHCALDHLRRARSGSRRGLKGVGGQGVPESAARAPGALDILIRHEEVDLLWWHLADAFQLLTPFEQYVFAGYYVAGDTVAGLARVCRRREQTIRCVLSRAKKKFLKPFGVSLTNRELIELFA